MILLDAIQIFILNHILYAIPFAFSIILLMLVGVMNYMKPIMAVYCCGILSVGFKALNLAISIYGEPSLYLDALSTYFFGSVFFFIIFVFIKK